MASLLHHLSVVAAASEMDGVNSILVVEEDVTVPPVKWWNVPGEHPGDNVAARAAARSIAAGLGIGPGVGQSGGAQPPSSASSSSSSSSSQPWEVVRFVGSFLHALRDKMDVTSMGMAQEANHSQVQGARCFKPCICHARPVAVPSDVGMGMDMDMCDVAGER